MCCSEFSLDLFSSPPFTRVVLTMAATELLDYNQVQEQSPSTGDSIPSTGGPIIWQFRADPNLAWDPSQSFFAMDVTIKCRDATGEAVTAYTPTPTDLRPFFPLRCFQSASHIIDGVTVAQSSHPYLDKIIQEKFLHETTLSNYSNYESLQLCRAIDDGIKEHNIFRAHADSLFDLYEQGWKSSIQLYNGARQGSPSGTANATFPTHTVIFQPPFDFWTKHQRVSGGNHQVILDLKAADGSGATDAKWGEYAATTCAGLAAARAGADLAAAGRIIGSGVAEGSDKTAFLTMAGNFENASGTIGKNLQMNIHRIRLMRRMVRFTIERPIATQEYNLTEQQLYVGQASATQQTQNFLLPSSTFGLVFFWRKASNSFYDVYNDFPVTHISNAGAATDITTHFQLDEFYFTYGGETYPAQRINKLSGQGAAADVAPGYEKLQMVSSQLMGTYNMPMEYLNTSYAGTGLMERLDSQMFFFPVAKHSNSDNSDLQVHWKGVIQDKPGTLGGSLATYSGSEQVSLCVVALYDARIELSYNSANQLEKVTKTEWK